ncbi:hypothetical protein D854_gp35 [Streptomyces phage R4]|uniref:Uncharacterized protein n=2 Tax=Arequatrovirus TaxID=1982881 RepID=K4HZZ4_9CAUD|nr:hypothetical protein D854_gp35 [Streptomyces phage R4]YP_010055921.1 hypothetical protein KGG91_gp55 [Streptomyces phage Paedore]AFU62107.1 hypothetical protein R4_54 [Streptomyces phage R4]AVO22538.1 hypothetical protein PBI_PAEDORE_55 [Streptomyces phage Paedore]
MSKPPQRRPEFLIERYPTLFSSEREKKLPVWAQVKLADLRLLLLQEAGNYEASLEEIDRLESGHHN